MQATVLIVDDQVDLANFIGRLIRPEGFEAVIADTGKRARELAGQVYPDVVLLDIRLPDANGVELLKEIREITPGSQFIMMTAHATIRSAVEATKLGAYDYLTKPFEPELLLVSLRNAMKDRALKEEVRLLRRRDQAPPGPRTFPSPAYAALEAAVARAAATETTVLLTGESGSGKNFFAARIHQRSARTDGPFLDINCAAITPSLIESELFGHEPGAFTGSRGRKRGLLELAEGGTLFLDEIGELDLGLQAKLLSFLDTHSLRRIGGETNIKVDARIIAATNRNLEQWIEEGRFRQDLYYRLNVLNLRVPALRERREDLPALAGELLERLAREMQLPETPTLSAEALTEIARQDWLGNVRELRNSLERALLNNESGTVIERIGPPARQTTSLPDEGCFEIVFPPSGLPLKETLSNLTANLIHEALRRSSTKKEAAALLGLTRNSLAHYLKSLGIEDDD